MITVTQPTSSSSSTSSTAPAVGRLPKLAAPFDPMHVVASATNLANFINGCRVVIPTTGTLHDLAVYVLTAAGNVRVGVYDTGDLSAGNRSLLYGSGSVAAAGTNAWQVVADPSLAVTAGQQLDFVVFPDTNGLVMGRATALAAASVNALPTSFLPVTGGASPKLNWAFNLAYAALPATISEANCGASGSAIWVGGRIT